MTVAETLANIVSAPDEEARLKVEEGVIVQTDNGLHDEDPLDQPGQSTEVQS